MGQLGKGVLMKIAFIRHGKSVWEENEKISSEQFREWVEIYDEKGVQEEEEYPQSTIEVVAKSGIVLTSDLKRSQHSANLLTRGSRLNSDGIFREVELPKCTFGQFIKCKPAVWLVVLRLLWMAGYSQSCESYKQARKRAKIGAERLVQYAKNKHTVVLVGHGFFNRLLAKELEKMGWITYEKMSSKHWQCITYEAPQ